MTSTILPDVDLIHEFQLRRWAREHFVPVQHRDLNWHPIILNEMSRRDSESDDAHLAS